MHRNCTLVIVTLLMSFVLVGSAQAASLPNAGPEGSAAAAIFAGGADTPPVCASPSPQLKSQVIYDCGKATCGTVTVGERVNLRLAIGAALLTHKPIADAVRNHPLALREGRRSSAHMARLPATTEAPELKLRFLECETAFAADFAALDYALADSLGCSLMPWYQRLRLHDTSER